MKDKNHDGQQYQQRTITYRLTSFTTFQMLGGFDKTTSNTFSISYFFRRQHSQVALGLLLYLLQFLFALIHIYPLVLETSWLPLCKESHALLFEI